MSIFTTENTSFHIRYQQLEVDYGDTIVNTFNNSAGQFFVHWDYHASDTQPEAGNNDSQADGPGYSEVAQVTTTGSASDSLHPQP